MTRSHRPHRHPRVLRIGSWSVRLPFSRITGRRASCSCLMDDHGLTHTGSGTARDPYIIDFGSQA